jgi:hypothetical protein
MFAIGEVCGNERMGSKLGWAGPKYGLEGGAGRRGSVGFVVIRGDGDQEGAGQLYVCMDGYVDRSTVIAL